MNALFQLDYSGEATGCDYPGCVLDSFHEGEHVFASAPNPAAGKAWEDVRKCVICGTRFVIYSQVFKDVRTCSSGCMLILAMREAGTLEVSCNCTQRSYPHELSVHAQIRGESYNPKYKFRWPWSLMLSQREEPSTERRQS